MPKFRLVAPTLLALAITACSTSPALQPAMPSLPTLSSSGAHVDGASVEVRIDTGTKLKTQAAKKTTADIHHYHIKLVHTTSGAVVAEGDTTEIVNFFHKVPNGTYQVIVDAIDADGNSIVQGGAQTSSNFVTVAAPNVTYSDGAVCLKVRLKLLNATGESVGSKIVVEDGDDWNGTPELQPGGNCPCPTPTPVPTASASSPAVFGTQDFSLDSWAQFGPAAVEIGLAPAVGEVFVPNTSGTFNRLELPLWGTGGNAHVRVYDYSNLSAPIVEAQATLPSTRQWVAFDFATPLSLVNGTKYVVVATYDDQTGGGNWALSTSDMPEAYRIWGAVTGSTFVNTSPYTNQMDFAFRFSMPSAN